MIINGKSMEISECMVKTKFTPAQQPKKPKAEDYIWVAYDDSKARLPMAISRTAFGIAKKVGVSIVTVYSVWSKYQKGVLSTAKYAKVYIGEEDECN